MYNCEFGSVEEIIALIDNSKVTEDTKSKLIKDIDELGYNDCGYLVLETDIFVNAELHIEFPSLVVSHEGFLIKEQDDYCLYETQHITHEAFDKLLAEEPHYVI